MARLQQVANDDPASAVGLNGPAASSSAGGGGAMTMDYENMSYNPRQTYSAPNDPPAAAISGRRSVQQQSELS